MDRGLFFQRLVDFFVGVALAILGLRVLFRLFGANAGAGFVDWVYTTSDVLLSPFRGIFPVAEIGDGNVLDIPALFAMLMYTLLGFLLSWLVSALTVPARRETVVKRR